MKVTPNGASEFHDGHEFGRYGRLLGSNDRVFVWYHSGLRCYDEPAWAMQTDAEWKISVSVDTIFVPDPDAGLFRIDRDGLAESREAVDSVEQCVARASDDFVSKVADDPSECLGRGLWMDSDRKETGYHKQKNEA